VKEEDKWNASLLLYDQSKEISPVKALTPAHGHLLAAATTTTPPPPGKAGSL
jgi:hypothetical protein